MSTLRKFCSPYIFIVLFFASFALHGQSLPPIPATSAAIDADDLRKHVRWLASDELEGRAVGTAAIDSAAAYIAREFQRYGLQPAGANGQWYQSFSIVTGATRGESTLAYSTPEREQHIDSLRFMPYAFSSSHSFEGPVVYAGYGFRDGGDYGDVNARDAVVLVLDGAPAAVDPHAGSAMLATARGKSISAREAGAAALLIVHANETLPRDFSYDGIPVNAGLPVARIDKLMAASILHAAGIDTTVLFSDSSVGTYRGDHHVRLRGSFDVRHVVSSVHNVAAILPGQDADNEGVIVVGAHYDHLGWGQGSSLYRGSEAKIHNGADDNASGTAGILELAEYFSEYPLDRSLLFIAFTAEEMGLLGSAHWVSNPTVPIETVEAMMNLDMVGRLDDGTLRLNVQGVGTSPLWTDIVTEANAEYGFDLALIEDGRGASDHASFYSKNIPVLFFFTGLHTDYHRPTDTWEKLNYTGQAEVIRFVADILKVVDANTDIPFSRVVRDEEQEVARFNVYVGVIPDYASSDEGFRISGTSPGSPAEKAGMLDGDIIIRFADTEVRNIFDYMTALSRHEAGDVVQVFVRRGVDEEELTVELVGR